MTMDERSTSPTHHGSAAAPVPERLLLVDPVEATRTTLARRLESLGYAVETARDGVEGAASALRSPPAAVIADLWLPGVSGIQLCRLLRAEPGTQNVPILLRGDEDDRRNRFWAERAGAFSLLGKGRIGELVRVLRRAVAAAPPPDEFFMQIDGSDHIHDRIARHLDAALFESVIAAEVRALASCESTRNLFDLLSQFLSQIHAYRWMAIATPGNAFFGVHHHAGEGERAVAEARRALAVDEGEVFVLEDEDAVGESEGPRPIVGRIAFGGRDVGAFALAPMRTRDDSTRDLVRVVARELGGALRMTALVEETQRLAATDRLTGLMNRRAFIDWAGRDLARLERYGGTLCLGVIDVDHFKGINDRFGHGGGDLVLREVARVLSQVFRKSDVVARWGGEEFVFALPSSSLEGARHAAERVRRELASNIVQLPGTEGLVVTVSIGVGLRRSRESLDALIDRADVAMYLAKQSGRDRVEVAPEAADALLDGVRAESSPCTLEVDGGGDVYETGARTPHTKGHLAPTPAGVSA
jgi:two-component system cell cycle response regulator